MERKLKLKISVVEIIWGSLSNVKCKKYILYIRFLKYTPKVRIDLAFDLNKSLNQNL